MKQLNQNKTLWMSHRGVKTHYPENTMGAYMDAVKAGIKAIELDVVMSKDKTLYCSHNHDLERETDGFGYIHELRDAEIDSYVAIHPNNGVKEKIPRLEDVFNTLPRDIYLNIEIKSRKFFEIDIAIRTARRIQKHNRQDQTMISSFNPLMLRVVRIFNRLIKTGYLIKSLFPMRLYRLSGADNIHPRADILNNDMIQYCKKRQIGIIPWTVNASPTRDHILAQEIESIISDERRILSSET